MKKNHSITTTDRQLQRVDEVAKMFGVRKSQALRALLYVGLENVSESDRALYQNIDNVLAAEQITSIGLNPIH